MMTANLPVKKPCSLRSFVLPNHTFAALLLAAVVAVGCAKKDTVQPGDSTGGNGGSPADTTGVMPGEPLGGDDMVGEAPAEDRRVYFAFDSDTIDAAGRAVIEANAKAVRANRNAKVTLEGHCDERGTREYNLALGERRAMAVSRMMQALGVPASQIFVVSFGEEKPADSGHDESAWSQNRRADIKY
jgi:peptidoglycan-associated lipoprotein